MSDLEKTFCLKHYRQTFPTKGCDMCEQAERIARLEQELADLIQVYTTMITAHQQEQGER